MYLGRATVVVVAGLTLAAVANTSAEPATASEAGTVVVVEIRPLSWVIRLARGER
jgi:hypothetical protein